MKNFLRLAILTGAMAATLGTVAAPAVAAPSSSTAVAAEAGNAHGTIKGKPKKTVCTKRDIRQKKPGCVRAAVRNNKKQNTVPGPPSNSSHDTHKNTNRAVSHNSSHDTHYTTSRDKHYNTTFNKTYVTNYNTTHNNGYGMGGTPVLPGLPEMPLLGTTLI